MAVPENTAINEGKTGPRKGVPGKGKKMTRILSFQPTDENRELLQMAYDAGISITELLNEAVAANGRQVLKKMAENTKAEAERILRNIGSDRR